MGELEDLLTQQFQETLNQLIELSDEEVDQVFNSKIVYKENNDSTQ